MEIIGLNSSVWYNGTDFDNIVSGEILRAILSMFNWKVANYIYDNELFSTIILPMRDHEDFYLFSQEKKINALAGRMELSDTPLIQYGNVIADAIALTSLEVADQKFKNRLSGVNTSEIANGTLSKYDIFDSYLKNSEAQYYSEAQYEALSYSNGEPFKIEGTSTFQAKLVFQHPADDGEYFMDEKPVPNYYREMAAKVFGDADLSPRDSRKSPEHIKENVKRAADNDVLDENLQYHDFISKYEPTPVIIDALRDSPAFLTRYKDDYKNAVDFIASFFTPICGSYSNLSAVNSICSLQYTSNYNGINSERFKRERKRLLTYAEIPEESVSFDNNASGRINKKNASSPGVTDEEKEKNLSELMDYQLIIDDDRRIVDFGTFPILQVLTELEEYISSNIDIINFDINQLESLGREIIDLLLKYDSNNSAYGPFASLVGKQVLVNYIEYLTDDKVTKNDFAEAVLRVDAGTFLLYTTLFYLQTSYTEISNFGEYIEKSAYENKNQESVSVENPFNTNSCAKKILNKLDGYYGPEKGQYGREHINLWDVLAQITNIHFWDMTSAEDLEDKHNITIEQAKTIANQFYCGSITNVT